MRVLLDTQVFVLAAQQGAAKLNVRVQKLLQEQDSDLLLSAVSLTEIAVKCAIGKLTMTADDAEKAVEDMRLQVMPFKPQHALKMFDLPLHHRDPFDRMLIATALWEAVPMITGDREFGAYKGLKVIF